MRKLLYATIILLIVSCTQEPVGPPTIAGEAPGVYNGMRVYLKELDPSSSNQLPIDTAIVMDEQFDFGPQPENEFARLRIVEVDGSTGSFIFLSENSPIHLSIDKDSLYKSSIEAGENNKLFQQYRELRIEQENELTEYRIARRAAVQTRDMEQARQLDSVYKIDVAQHKNSMIEFMREHPNHAIAALTINHLSDYNVVDDTEIRNLYDQLGDQIKKHPIAVKLEQYLEQVEAVNIGKKAPYFEGLNPEGEVIKLPEVLGKVTLVDFWASWCKPCREENPNVVAAYEKYHDKGFNIISVSLDKKEDRDKWIEAIQQDQMTWNHISRLQQWQDPIARKYNVNGIPATFLLDENGIIIVRNLRGQALHDRLEGLLD